MGEKKIEWVAEIWHEHGECLQIGEDRDGLDMTEIRFRTDDGRVSNAVTFTDDVLPLIVEALQERMRRKGIGT